VFLRCRPLIGCAERPARPLAAHGRYARSNWRSPARTPAARSLANAHRHSRDPDGLTLQTETTAAN
jgi:hypothetical protein